MSPTYIHATAEVDPRADLGDDVQVWNWTKIREGARLGPGCRLGQGVYVDHDVTIGDGTKVQNGVSVYHGVTLGSRVFVGPHVAFTNDRVPRADSDDWTVTVTVVEDHASIGANATILCGVRLGRACMVAAGAVVTRDIPPYALAMGTPARVVDYVTLDGDRRHVGAQDRSGQLQEESP